MHEPHASPGVETSGASAPRTEVPRADAPRLIIAGNASVDLLLGPLAPWPDPGTEAIVDTIGWRVGGALGNTALALAGLAIPATLVWDVGDDVMGEWLRTMLGGAGDPPRVLASPTSVTVALTHPDGERTFVSHLGHLATSAPDALEDAIERAGARDILLVGGTFLMPRWRAALPRLLARARERGLTTALDTGWPTEGWTDAVRGELLAMLAHVDLFLPNLEEARGVLGRPDLHGAEALASLARSFDGRVALKLGPDGAAYAVDGRVATVPAPTSVVADTVGAGDTFNAALLAACRDGVTWADAVTIAVATASRVIATAPRRFPRWDEVREARSGIGVSAAAGAG